MESKIIKAVQLIKADAQLSVSGEDIDSIVWENGEAPISKSEIEAKISEVDEAEAQKVTDKASAKAKLIAGEALTEAEADTIVL